MRVHISVSTVRSVLLDTHSSKDILELTQKRGHINVNTVKLCFCNKSNLKQHKREVISIRVLSEIFYWQEYTQKPHQNSYKGGTIAVQVLSEMFFSKKKPHNTIVLAQKNKREAISSVSAARKCLLVGVLSQQNMVLELMPNRNHISVNNITNSFFL